VAKKQDPAAHSHGFENVDWEMQLSAYRNGGVRHLATATAVAWCGEEHLQKQWQLIFQETGVALGCQALFNYKRHNDLASNNSAPNVNRKIALKMSLFRRVRIIEWPNMWIPCVIQQIQKDWLLDILDLCDSNWAQNTSLSYGHPIAGHLCILLIWVTFRRTFKWLQYFRKE
jgi:hypothetical protein